METKLCRICGKLAENYVHIFKTEGLRNKIETSLPIIVSPHCLLPDTICSECLENVNNFYSFIKNCLQNIIILEAQYDITESCLKTKRKHDKSSCTDFSNSKCDKNIQTDADLDVLCSQQKSYSSNCVNYTEVEKINTALLNAYNILNSAESASLNQALNSGQAGSNVSLVSYDVNSESDSENGDNIQAEDSFVAVKRYSYPQTNVYGRDRSFNMQKQYFDDLENDIISEISQRKCLKRQTDEILPYHAKIFKLDTSNRRKNKQPKKLANISSRYREDQSNLSFSQLEVMYEEMGKNYLPCVERQEKQVEKESNSSPFPYQICLLCDMQFSGASSLASHVYETHGIDMAQILSSEPVMEKKKRIPNLVKITDLKFKESSGPAPVETAVNNEDPPLLHPSHVCPICPAVLTNRNDLFMHLKVKHGRQASLLCGLCLHVCSSYLNLCSHISICKQHHVVNCKYVCKLCCFNDDNSKNVENHVVVHDFILKFCKKEAKIFDPSDYVEVNAHFEGSMRTFTCTECNQNNFATFKEFSTHRRSQHQIFHCDLCNKFYGRNSHLWKHVNRLHKGHPSITCQLCYKTSASKYHLSQHFNKIHSVKPLKQKQNEVSENGTSNFLNQKFEAFDFQSVKQSFMRQDLLKQERKMLEYNSDNEQYEGQFEGDDSCNVDFDVSKSLTVDGGSVSRGAEYEDEINQEKTVKKDSQARMRPPKEIDSSSDLYTNIITNYTPPQNDGEYKCSKCCKGFHKKTLLKKHKKNCRPRLQKDLLTRCKTCSRIFKDRQSLTKHLINYHSEYTCEICGQKVQSKCEIVSHIRFSHPSCHLFCHCGNILRNNADLYDHKKDHGNSFVCQFCADVLPTKIKLKMHILSLHRKILSLSCGICLKLFETQHILRDHVRLVHKDHLSPLTSCTVCGKNYGSKWKTYDHLNKSHGRIFKPCKACLDVFDTEDELQLHYDSVHVNSSASESKGAQVQQNAFSNVQLLVPKKENCNSDVEAINDDNEEKSSCSDFSNDTDTNHYPDKGPSDAEEFAQQHGRNQGDFSSIADLVEDDGKVSLLEKRLLGKKPENLPGLSVVTKELNCSKPPRAESPKMEKKPPIVIKREQQQQEENEGASHNPLQNSSKRTVYVNSNDPSVCEICFKVWPAKKHLWQHYIRCHKRVAATVCGICLKTNESYGALQTHLQSNHPTLLHGQGFGSNFICRICGRYHNASSKLRLHMAIHEHFDWSILEEGNANTPQKSLYPFEAESEDKIPVAASRETEQIGNGIKEENCSENEEDINYESLIEQVECTSAESENDSESESFTKTSMKSMAERNSSTDDETDDKESIVASEENSLETQMLQNMLNEKRNLLFKRKVAKKVVVKREEFSTSDSEESSESNHTIRSNEEQDEVVVARVKSEAISSSEEEEDEDEINYELDSAVRSISYDEQINSDEQVDGEFCEMQVQNLNQHEIESAVDSIL